MAKVDPKTHAAAVAVAKDALGYENADPAVLEAAIVAYLDALGDTPYRSRPDVPYTADRVPVLDPAALEEAASAFPAGGSVEDAAAAIVSAYLAALPAAEAPARPYNLDPSALGAAIGRRIHAGANIADCIRTYLDAVPKAEKPARVEPTDNPNRRQYVDFKTADGRTEAYFCYAGENYGGLTVPGPGFDYSPARQALMYGIDVLCAATHAASWNAGWYTDPKTGKVIERNVGEVIALMHSELSEALEGYRKGLMDDHLPNRLQIEVEFADTVIRIADTCGHLGLDLAGAIVDKMRYNATREDHKLEARANGGKSF